MSNVKDLVIYVRKFFIFIDFYRVKIENLIRIFILYNSNIIIKRKYKKIFTNNRVTYIITIEIY